MPETGKMSRKIELPLHSIAIKGDAYRWVFAPNGTFEFFQLLHLLAHLELLVVLIQTQAFSTGTGTYFHPVAIVRLSKKLCILDSRLALRSGHKT